MSYVSLPSDKLKAAILAAMKDNDDGRKKLVEQFKKYRKWSWRKFRMVDAELDECDALRRAREYREGFLWGFQNERLKAVQNDMLPLCSYGDTVNVEQRHLAAFSSFYQK